MDTYGSKLLVVLLGKRARLGHVTHAKIVERFLDLGPNVFQCVVTVLAKIEPLATMARPSFQEGVIHDDVEIRD